MFVVIIKLATFEGGKLIDTIPDLRETAFLTSVMWHCFLFSDPSWLFLFIVVVDTIMLEYDLVGGDRQFDV